ncbi:MAG: polysaccharide biosynthesis/export family protein, partial [bacterium]
MKATLNIIISLSLILIFSLIINKKNLYAQDDNYMNGDYKIGAEDVLYISVWENEKLSREVIVRPDGMISFPLLDDLKVNGLTPLEVKEIITKRLASFVKDPQVTVILQSINNYKVYLMGAVDSSGVFTLKRKTSLLQLLAVAGGLLLVQNADLNKAYLLRDK